LFELLKLRFDNIDNFARIPRIFLFKGNLTRSLHLHLLMLILLLLHGLNIARSGHLLSNRGPLVELSFNCLNQHAERRVVCPVLYGRPIVLVGCPVDVGVGDAGHYCNDRAGVRELGWQSDLDVKRSGRDGKFQGTAVVLALGGILQVLRHGILLLYLLELHVTDVLKHLGLLGRGLLS
jgi:hypothetical protein